MKKIKYTSTRNLQEYEESISDFVAKHLRERNPDPIATVVYNIDRAQQAIADLCQILADKNLLSIEDLKNISGPCVHGDEAEFVE